jgi:hypothetical protein
MNAKNKKDNLNDILKETHGEIQPFDSWEALRSRIDKRIEKKKTSNGFITKLNGNLIFWRRAAIVAAACLVITSFLLVYVIFNNHNNGLTGNHSLLAKDQVKQLSEAFSQVQDLFNQNCPWIVINSSGKGEIGDENQKIDAAKAKNIIILRLAVNLHEDQTVPQYFDVVTFNNQLVSFSMPVKDKSNMSISLRPVINANNKIEVEIDTQLNSGLKTSNTVTIADDSFKTLARVKSNGSWININATGQSLSNI